MIVMNELDAKITKTMENLDFLNAQTLELARLTKGSYDALGEMPDSEKFKDFGQLGCDVLTQANHAKDGIDNPQELHEYNMKEGVKTGLMLIQAYDFTLPGAETLLAAAEDSELYADLSEKLKTAKKYRKVLGDTFTS